PGSPPRALLGTHRPVACRVAATGSDSLTMRETQAMMTPSLSPPALQLVRLPGEFGPILRCSGELSVATAEALRRELALLMPMGHPVLTLSLSGCRFLDVGGIMTILDACKRLRQEGRRL